MLNQKDLKKCHFIPMSLMRKVIKKLESPDTLQPSAQCKRNLATLQAYRCGDNFRDQTFRNYKNWKTMFHVSCWKAIYAHDWNKLLYLLKKCQHWKHNLADCSLYVRCLTILLMYHPTSQAKGLLNDYMHMALSCRTDEDKKALLKILLTLPDKIHAAIKIVERRED